MQEKWPAELEAFHQEIERYHLGPLWAMIQGVITKEPATDAVPYLWKWSVIRDRVMRSGELVTPERGGERRVIYLENPGLKAKGIPLAVTRTLYVGIQLLLPGEVAPSHRHIQGAIRFILEGEKAYTVVEGEKVYMEKGDFILTPQWTWHDHGHEGTEPMIWMDGLDVPLLDQLKISFFEPYPEYQQPVRYPANYSARRYGGGMMRPVGARRGGKEYPSSLILYTWEQTKRALDAMSELEPDPYDGYALEYINPNNGESADARIGSWMQKLTPGMRTKAHRHVSSVVYHVKEGRGYTVINGERFDWETGDFFVVPPWMWHEHVNTGESDAYLFSINDRPVMEKLGLEREEEHPEGHQDVVRVFEPLR